MSSNIEIQRICEFCGNEFTARTTVTKLCSEKCRKSNYKKKQRAEKIQNSNDETKKIKNKPIEDLKAKEFLTVRDIATLLNCSIRSVYHYIENGTIKAVNLGQRITRVKRSELDKLFEQKAPEKIEALQFNISDCYTLTEVINKYSIAEPTLRNLIKRNNIPKIKKGRFAYVPKTVIDKLLI